MKRHIKRIATPPTWDIARKEETYIMRPNSGGQPMAYVLPLGVILRMTHTVTTLKEIKYVLSQSKVQVDGKVRKDHKFAVGFLSTVSIPDEKKHFRLSLTTKGTLALVPISDQEAHAKVAKVKDILKRKDGFCFTTSDGRMFASAKKATATAGSILFTVPGQELKETFPLAKGNTAFIIAGKHPGIVGTITAIDATGITIHAKDGTFSVNKENLIIVGKEKPAITLA